jgi:hypothetical protein
VSKGFIQYEQEVEEFDFEVSNPAITRKFKDQVGGVERVSKKSNKVLKKFKPNREN